MLYASSHPLPGFNYLTGFIIRLRIEHRDLHMRKRYVFPVGLVLFLLSGSFLRAAPEADLWSYWKQHNPDSEQQIDHSPWDHFLKRYVVEGKDGINRVQYDSVTDQYRQKLEKYVERLETITITNRSRPVQKAYWINLYNALTILVVLEHYPVESIRDIDISPGWFSSGPWGKKLLTIEGKDVSLNDIEHRILRPIWADPRIHYAVNCASMGCPNLQREAFTAENLNQLLEKGAREYTNHPRGVEIRDNEVYASSIYGWFQEDFGGSERNVLNHLKKYADKSLRRKLDQFQEIYDYRYDWTLNDVDERQEP